MAVSRACPSLATAFSMLYFLLYIGGDRLVFFSVFGHGINTMYRLWS